MPGFRYTSLLLLVAASLVLGYARADHVAIIYCALEDQKIRVVAADSDIGARTTTSAKRGQSCSQVLHEFLGDGYALLKGNLPAAADGHIVFVLVHEE